MKELLSVYPKYLRRLTSLNSVAISFIFVSQQQVFAAAVFASSFTFPLDFLTLLTVILTLFLSTIIGTPSDIVALSSMTASPSTPQYSQIQRVWRSHHKRFNTATCSLGKKTALPSSFGSCSKCFSGK